jgi:hypothetical protein
MSTDVNNPEFEYIHSCYAINNKSHEGDAVFVKRNRFVKNADGTDGCTPEYVFHENVKRDFWITKKAHQKHQYKLETEYLQNLINYKTTQRDLIRQVQYKLSKPYTPQMRLAECFRSPFVYGCDIDINSVVKLQYEKKFKRSTRSRLTVAVQDTEFDMNGNLGMIIFSMSFKDKAYQVVLNKWVNPGDTAEEYRKFIEDELPEIKDRKIKLELDFVNNMVDGIKKMYEKANEWMPDVIGFWNINYDMSVILDILRDANVDPKDIFSHSSVPPEFKHFEFKRGPLVKRKDDGTSRPLAVSEQWHTVYSTSPFYFIDPASLFRGLRKMKAEPSYSLDYLTTKYLGQGKYHVEHELLKGIPTGTGRWHMVMQKHFKKEYCAYGLIDCIRVEEFDEKFKDISTKLPLLLGNSQIKDFNSNPRKLCDALHTFCLENDQVMSTTSDRMKEEIDKMVIGKELWINILEATHLEDIGIQLVKDDKTFLKSRTTIHNYDLDLISAYPKIGILLGLCRRNTVFEICKIQGIDSFQHRYVCVNLTGGYANAITTCRDLYKLKTLQDLHKDFAAAHKLPAKMYQEITVN